jgi:hypothetical protein
MIYQTKVKIRINLSNKRILLIMANNQNSYFFMDQPVILKIQ